EDVCPSQAPFKPRLGRVGLLVSSRDRRSYPYIRHFGVTDGGAGDPALPLPKRYSELLDSIEERSQGTPEVLGPYPARVEPDRGSDVEHDDLIPPTGLPDHLLGSTALRVRGGRKGHGLLLADRGLVGRAEGPHLLVEGEIVPDELDAVGQQRVAALHADLVEGELPVLVENLLGGEPAARLVVMDPPDAIAGDGQAIDVALERDAPGRIERQRNS